MNSPRIDIVYQATGSHAWCIREGWANTARRLGLLHRVFEPKANWGDADTHDDDGLFEYLGRPEADIILLLGFDWHSQPLHRSARWQERWATAKVHKLCYIHESIENNCLLFGHEQMREAALSAGQCVDGIICPDPVDRKFLLEHTGRPVLVQPYGVDEALFHPTQPFALRKRRAFFRGNTTAYQSNSTYSERRTLIEHLTGEGLLDLMPFEATNTSVERFVQDYNDHQIAINFPSLSIVHSTRVFEAMASGCALVACATGRPEQDALFEDGRHLLYYSTKEQLAEHVRALTADPERARQLADSGREWVLANYTIGRHLRQLIDFAGQSNVESAEDTEKKPDPLLVKSGPRRRTRVLHIIRDLSMGGACRASIISAKHSQKLGEFDHALLPLSGVDPKAVAFARAAGLRVVPGGARSAIMRAIKDADIVQVEFWNTPEIHQFLASELPPCRLVVRCHVNGVNAPQVITRELAEGADALILTSPFTQAKLPYLQSEALSKRIQLAYSCFDPERLSGFTRRAHEGFNVGYIGTVDPVKMHPDYVAMSDLVRTLSARFIVCGGGDYSSLAESAARLGASARFDFRGYVEDIRSVLETLDIFGYPLSESNYATSEVVLQEAMYCGLPAVVFPHGGLDGIVVHGETGFVVNTAEEYAQAIDFLFQNPGERRRLGENARQRARTVFDSEANTRLLQVRYSEMMQVPKASHRIGRPRVPGPTEGAQMFIASLGEHAADFATSLASGSPDEVAAADGRIARATAVLGSRMSGGIQMYRDAYPQDGCLRYWTGLFLDHNGRFDEAAKEFEFALQLGFEVRRVHERLAETLARVERTDEALHHANAAMKAGSASAEILKGRLIAAVDREKVLSRRFEGLQSTPEATGLEEFAQLLATETAIHGRLHLETAKALRAHGRLPVAIAMLEALVERAPWHFDAGLLAIEFAILADDLVRALHLLQKLRNRFGADRRKAGDLRYLGSWLVARRLRNEARAFMNEGDWAQAVQRLKDARNFHEADHSVHFDLLAVHLQMGNEEDAAMIARGLAARNIDLSLLPAASRRFVDGLNGGDAGPDGAIRVSAIVSTYNSARFLRGCLDDLLRQTLYRRGELEIIVINSASPENEEQIVREYQATYPNIVYIACVTRETVYGAWNRGVKAARGQYLTNANTDDRHRVDALEILARTLDRNPDVSVAYGDCLVTRTENETFEQARPLNLYQWLDFNAEDLLLKGCLIGPQPMWRRDVHDEHGWFDDKMVSSGDYEFWLRLAQNRTFLHVRETLGLYLESPGSVEHSNADRAKQEALLAQERYRKAILGRKPAGANASPKNASSPTGLSAGVSMPPAGGRQRSLPACATVGNLDGASEWLRQKKLPEAWGCVLEALKARPFHPEAYLLLAEIAKAAGDSASARHCAQRARDLVPGYKPAKTFLKGELRGNTKHDWLVVPEEVQRRKSKEVQRLSVCLIVKNEERFLAGCLASIQGIADQIVVVDTGSTDRSVTIAKSMGAEVHTFDWCDDFSAARNASLERASGDWVLVLDADEELPAASHAALRKEMSDPGVMAWRLPIVDAGKEENGRTFVPRLFRNAPGLYFSGRIHEHAFGSVEERRKEWGLDNRLGSAGLVHHGYTQELTKERNKVGRNLRLLELAVKESPGVPLLQMNLGLELVRSGRLDDGIKKYRTAYTLLSREPAPSVIPELREMLLTQFTTHLLSAKLADEVVRVFNSPLAKQGGLTASLHYLHGVALLQMKQFAEAAAQMRLCLGKRDQATLTPMIADVRGSGPRHCLALSLARSKSASEAEPEFIRAMSESPEAVAVKVDYARFLAEQDRAPEALQFLHQLVSQTPGIEAAWVCGGQIVLSKGDFLDVALDWTAVAAENLPGSVAIGAQRAEALMLAGEPQEALNVLNRLTVPASPSLAAIRVICEIAGEVAASAALEALPAATDQEFIRHYWRLVEFRAESTLLKLHDRVGQVALRLPESARLIRSVIEQLSAPVSA